jgi:hypothetical protein
MSEGEDREAFNQRIEHARIAHESHRASICQSYREIEAKEDSGQSLAGGYGPSRRHSHFMAVADFIASAPPPPSSL